MTTPENINNSLAYAGGNTAALTLIAIQEAAQMAFRLGIKKMKYASSVATLAAQTYTYSLSALTDIPYWGVSQVFVAPASSEGPELRIREVSQYQTGGVWWLKFAPGAVSAYAGRAVNLLYWVGPTVPANSGDTLDSALPEDYLKHYVLYWYAKKTLTQQGADQGSNRELLETAERDWRSALKGSVVFDTLGVVPHVPARDIL